MKFTASNADGSSAEGELIDHGLINGDHYLSIICLNSRTYESRFYGRARSFTDLVSPRAQHDEDLIKRLGYSKLEWHI
jgi:hypothetical protein